MVIGDTKSITDGISLRYLSYMLDDMFSQNYYSGISTSAMVDHYSYDWKETSWYKATH